MSEDTKRYKVLGVEGNKVEVNGVEYDGGIGVEVDLTDAEAEAPLAESKIELVEAGNGGGEGGEGGEGGGGNE